VRTILKIVRTMHSVIGGSGWPRRGNPETKWRRLSSAGVRARAHDARALPGPFIYFDTTRATASGTSGMLATSFLFEFLSPMAHPW
jgi:hypothetical protein